MALTVVREFNCTLMILLLVMMKYPYCSRWPFLFVSRPLSLRTDRCSHSTVTGGCRFEEQFAQIAGRMCSDILYVTGWSMWGTAGSFLLAGNLLRSCSDNRLNAVLVMFRNSCFSASKIKLIRGWLIDRARPMNFSNGISRYSLCQEWGVGTALVFIFALTPSILMIRIQTDTSLASAVLKSLCLTHQMERCASDVCMHVLRLRLSNVFEWFFFFEKVYQTFKPWVYC